MFERIKNFLKRIFSRLSPDENVLYYINTPDALPHPYSAEEENALISRLSGGELAVRNDLIEHNLRLVIYIARKFDNTGLIKAVNSFQPDKNIKLATYASRCIENEILMYLRRTVRLKNEVSFDEPLNTDWEGNELLLSDVMGTDSDVVYKDIEVSVETELLNQALTKLNKRERRIIEMRYGLSGGEEQTQKQVADALGIAAEDIRARLRMSYL